MKKSLLLSISLLVVIGLVAGTMSVKAQDTGSVTATVTVQHISISIEPGEVTYGTLSSGGVQDTTATGTGETQTATNDSNVDVDLTIKGADVATGDCSWTLGAAQGDETYFHNFSTDSGENWSALTTDYSTLADSVGPKETQDFDLQIGVPSTTECTSQVTVNVTVQVEAAN